MKAYRTVLGWWLLGVAVLLLGLALMDAWQWVEIDWCAAGVEARAQQYHWVSRGAWLNFSLLLVWIAFLVLPFVGSTLPVSLRRRVVLALLALNFYLATYFLCNWLKVLLDDRTCSQHGNSVSGHFHFYVYVTLMLLYMYFALRPRNWGIAHWIFVIIFLVHFIIACITLFETWSYGYHSPRQILYGVLLGLLTHFLFLDVFDWALLSPSPLAQIPSKNTVFALLIHADRGWSFNEAMIRRPLSTQDVVRINRIAVSTIAVTHASTLALVFFLPEARVLPSDVIVSAWCWGVILLLKPFARATVEVS